MTIWPNIDISQSLESSPAVDLERLRDSLYAAHTRIAASPFKLDVSRGKPSGEQLDLSNGLLDRLPSYCTNDGADARNYYGSAQGLHEVRELFSQMLGSAAEDIVIGTNSSLALMHDVMAFGWMFGMTEKPWSTGRPTKFLCPSPGYDRHFSLCEGFGIQMVSVPLTGHGPNMDKVRQMVQDPDVKGIWCVPQYSNPTGETYAPDVVKGLASMVTAAPDFRIFWDNAYAVHHLTDAPQPVSNILQECARAGNPDRAFVFGSTSKITFAGGGLGLFASSRRNTQWLLKHLSRQTIGPEKLNQLRHLALLRNHDSISRHMLKHRAIIQPKFSTVVSVFEKRLGRAAVAQWTNPQGGYFISLDVEKGCAKRVVELASQAGVKMAAAGQTYPYGIDPADSNLRIAPTFPSVAEVGQAAEVVSLCVALAWLDRRLVDEPGEKPQQ